MKKIIFKFIILVSLTVQTACSSDDSNAPIQKLEITINEETLVFNSVVVDRLGSNEERFFIATINNSTNNIISFLADVGEEGFDIVKSFTYSTNGRLYKLSQSSDNFIDSVTINNNARFTMSFSGRLSTYNIESEMYESIDITNGKLDVEY
jgi:hypothetical protein